MRVVLETERLLLRHFTEADAEALLHMERDPDVHPLALLPHSYKGLL